MGKELFLRIVPLYSRTPVLPYTHTPTLSLPLPLSLALPLRVASLQASLQAWFLRGNTDQKVSTASNHRRHDGCHKEAFSLVEAPSFAATYEAPSAAIPTGVRLRVGILHMRLVYLPLIILGFTGRNLPMR